MFNKDIEWRLDESDIHLQDEDAVKSIIGDDYECMFSVQLEKKRKARPSFMSDSGKISLLGTGIFTEEAGYYNDYTHWRTFELVATDIRKEQVDGATAELGVFRGDFSRLIHATFPESNHYMFDTFSGFDENEKEREIQNGTCNEIWAASFKDTDVDIVMKGMVTPENCIVRKGLFPETLQLEDDELRFKFVSIDVDFEESTYQGLSYFVPRMQEGGCIFIHDYNAGSIQRAIGRYEKDNGIRLKGIHLSDVSGTYIVRF